MTTFIKQAKLINAERMVTAEVESKNSFYTCYFNKLNTLNVKNFPIGCMEKIVT